MKKIILNIHPAVFRKSFVLIFIFTTLAGAANCLGQNIVSKWKGGTAKLYYSSEYAKETGKSMEEKTAAELGNYTIEFKSDHSFTESFITPQDSKVTTINGIWKLTGDDLELTIDAKYNPQKTTTKSKLSIQGNTMVTTALMPGAPRIIKMESTNTRM
jgi:hypothetical protein